MHNDPANCVDLWGLLVNAVAQITEIVDGTAYGTIVFTDEDTGKTITADFISGGKPVGEPIPDGDYDILQPVDEKGHYRLEALDANYGDDKVDGTTKSTLRLHGMGQGFNFGCISITDDNKMAEIDAMLKQTKTEETTGKSKTKKFWTKEFWTREETQTKYGTLTVSTCNNA